MNKFKIFYSWQSDLPKDQTRNFIRKCIDEAIDLAEESEAIEAVRDYMVDELLGGLDCTKGTDGCYSWHLKDGREVQLKINII